MDRIVTTTNGIYLWSSVTQIFHKSELSYDGDCNTFHVMINWTNRNPWFRTFLVSIMMGTNTFHMMTST